ncbi:uncharacterized protein F5Z01DRAFT_430359 [Emericellopsis atlantica]|uniref:Uncharacterized protein n=1 Tax=Emericellopsis atlantica TaxID=2614577 RepID=A0A9P7ZEL3_9HYPO|nr:uncharacterized protein F5Z01DRAFT_430359 [Emericellopsis atlantica]KAG9250053.1 hypothetical protein F5Z01DRAFT_430359 [Emericellopsis atlantica]
MWTWRQGNAVQTSGEPKLPQSAEAQLLFRSPRRLTLWPRSFHQEICDCKAIICSLKTVAGEGLSRGSKALESSALEILVAGARRVEEYCARSRADFWASLEPCLVYLCKMRAGDVSHSFFRYRSEFEPHSALARLESLGALSDLTRRVSIPRIYRRHGSLEKVNGTTKPSETHRSERGGVGGAELTVDESNLISKTAIIVADATLTTRLQDCRIGKLARMKKVRVRARSIKMRSQPASCELTCRWLSVVESSFCPLVPWEMTR